MTNNAAEGGTMRRASEGLISPAQVHPSAGISGGWDKRTRGTVAICHLILWPTWVLFYEPASSQPVGGDVFSLTPFDSNNVFVAKKH